LTAASSTSAVRIPDSCFCNSAALRGAAARFLATGIAEAAVAVWHEPCLIFGMETKGGIGMKHKNLYALTLTSAAMLCGTGTIAWAQDHDNGQAPATHSGTTRNQPAGAVRAGKLIGATVKNKAGDSIGEISDLLVSPNGNVTTAVVSAGGVLGVGEKKIGVPYKSFTVSPDGKTLYLDMTAEQLKSMPPYTDDEKGAAKTSQNNPSNKFEHSTAATPSTTVGASKSAHVLKATEEPASALIGAEVVDKGDAKVGKIKDVIVSTSGRGAQAVLAVGGGIANIGGREIAIPLDNLTIQRGDANPKHEPQRVQTNLTVSELEALPEFRYE
jgi:sporulation protein YlmC with PRC-barrel domain